jgi:hypothetical protein
MTTFIKSCATSVFQYCWILLFLAGCQINPTGSDLTERLIAQPPSGWTRVYQLNRDGNRISEFVPADEEPNRWVNKISFEAFLDIHHADPIELLLYEVEQYQKRCNFVQHFNLFSGYENGYPTSLRLIMCGKSKQLETGEVSMVKAILGEQSFYVIKLAHKVAPFEVNKAEVTQEEIAQWSTFMKRVVVCDPDTTEHPCPQIASEPPP